MALTLGGREHEAADESGLSKQDRKRAQNRIAQRNYRRNQKQRILALEAVAAQSREAGLFSYSLDRRTDSISPKAPLETPAPTLVASPFDSDPQTQDQPAWNMDPAWDDLPWEDPSATTTTTTTTPPSTAAPSTRTNSESLSFLSSHGRTALHHAISSRNLAMVKLLLEHGADVSKQDAAGCSPLHLAVESGCEELVRLLLDQSANPDEVDCMGRTVLFKAVQNDHEGIARLLLDASADVNLKDALGHVALHLAVERGSAALTLLLLKYGANIDA